jgi:hypothetical protein
MKYLETQFIRKNLNRVFIVLGILIIIYYLYSNYRFAYKTPFGYIENLDNCRSIDCGNIKTKITGTSFKDDEQCKAGIADCIPGSRCRICTSSSTNNVCIGDSSGSCVKDGDDPWSTGKHMGCCADSKEFLNTWDGGRNYYKCCIPSSILPQPIDSCANINCVNGDCVNGDCICKDNYTGDKCQIAPINDPCTGITCPEGQECQNGKCVSSNVNYPEITTQPKGTLQIVNNTSQDPLHIFLATNKNQWTQSSGNGTIYPEVNWGERGNQSIVAWNPLGAIKSQEVMIPKNGYTILNIPSDYPKSRISPVAFKNNTNKPSTTTKMIMDNIYTDQWSLLLEGGNDQVFNTSAVDGINFKVKFQLTSDNNSIKTTIMNKNPCEGLDDKYKLSIGCRSPAIVDCNGTSTCECMPGTQNCMFSKCSEKLFNIPNNLEKYIGKYDGGDPKGVKPFINDTKNIKQNTPLSKYCNYMQSNSGDFTTYCYDYNDLHSSPWFRDPFKAKITYKDLTDNW